MHYTSTLSLFYEVEHEISQSKKVIRVTILFSEHSTFVQQTSTDLILYYKFQAKLLNIYNNAYKI